MTKRKLEALLNYSPTATAEEAASLQHETFYTVQEAIGAFSVSHETTIDYSQAVDNLLARVNIDVANGMEEDIAQNNYIIEEV